MLTLIEKVRELLQELAASNDSPEGHILGWLEREFHITEKEESAAPAPIPTLGGPFVITRS